MNNVHPSSTGDHPIRPRHSGLPDRGRGRVPLASDAAALARPAAVVRHRRHVLDPGDLEARGRERADRGLAARSRALHEHIDPLEPVLLRGPRRLLHVHPSSIQPGKAIQDLERGASSGLLLPPRVRLRSNVPVQLPWRIQRPVRGKGKWSNSERFAKTFTFAAVRRSCFG